MARFIQLFVVATLIASGIGSNFSFAQSKDFTLKEAVLKRFSSFAPKRMDQLQWVKGTSTLSYIETRDGIQTLLMKAAEGKPKVALTTKALNEWMGDGTRLETFPPIQWTSATSFQFQKEHVVYAVDIKKKQVKKAFTLPESAEEITFNPNRTACAFVKEHNLYILSADGAETQITTDGVPGIVYGKAVHRNEFGINNGLFWSNDGTKLAFYRMDERMVTDYPLVDINTQPAHAEEIKYPMAGQQSHHVTLGCFDVATKNTRYMATGEGKDHYLCSVTWSPDGNSIYIALLNRDQNHLKLNRYDATEGSLDLTLFEETDPKYIEPENPLWFLPHDQEKFIWMSERDGYQHLYLYDVSGKMIRPLTTGKWEAQTILGLDESKRFLYVRGTGEPIIDVMERDYSRNGTQRYTYVVNIEMGGINFLDKRIGTHSASLSDDGKFLFEHYTSLDTPLETTLFTAQGKKIELLHQAEDPLKDYTIGKPEIGMMLGGGQGEQLFTRIIKPSNFDASKKYPVLVYVYGGPHAQLITNSYLAGAPMWMYWMAEQGYIVATVDNRGSSNRGIAFEQSTFRSLGQQEMVDQKLFVDILKDLPYVDGNRLAIHGWSYGGFMTINMMTTFPGLFKVGVAGGPVCDWSLYEVMYTERYMDTPEANPEGYARANLVDRAHQLQDPLLIIHGTMDNVVLWQHSQEFVKACIDSEVQLDYFIYPGHEHNVRGKDRYHLMEKVLTYIDDKIGSPTP